MTLEDRCKEAKEYVRANKELFRHNHELIEQAREYQRYLSVEQQLPEYGVMPLSQFMLEVYLPQIHWGTEKKYVKGEQ
jgi:hypothetical protein